MYNIRNEIAARTAELRKASQKFDSLQARFERMESRIDRLERELRGVRTRGRNPEPPVQPESEQRMAVVEQGVMKLEQRMLELRDVHLADHETLKQRWEQALDEFGPRLRSLERFPLPDIERSRHDTEKRIQSVEERVVEILEQQQQRSDTTMRGIDPSTLEEIWVRLEQLQSTQNALQESRIRDQENLLLRMDEKLCRLEEQERQGFSFLPREEGDELTRIKGIGPGFERALKRVGVTTFTQIATWSEDDIQRIAREINTKPSRIQREGWVKSAQALSES